jgi:hypothetical protein
MNKVAAFAGFLIATGMAAEHFWQISTLAFALRNMIPFFHHSGAHGISSPTCGTAAQQDTAKPASAR